MLVLDDFRDFKHKGIRVIDYIMSGLLKVAYLAHVNERFSSVFLNESRFAWFFVQDCHSFVFAHVPLPFFSCPLG